MNSEPEKPRWQLILEALAGSSRSRSRRKDIEDSLDREWYTVPQAADVLGEHPKTVYGRVRRGEIKASRPSPRKTRIHKNDLVSYVLRDMM